MGIKVIEIEISALQEIILDISERHPGGMSAERIRFILEGKDIPLSPFQVRQVLLEMTTLKLLTRVKRSRTYSYGLPKLIEKDVEEGHTF